MRLTTPSQILYAAFHNKPPAHTGVPCAICGALTGDLPRKPIIKATFTNVDLLARPDSGVACSACAFALETATFRRKSFLCTASEFQEIDRAVIGEKLILGALPSEPFIVSITTSYKKHLWLRCPVNLSPHRFDLCFDETILDVAPQYDRALMESVTELYQTFTKTEIAAFDFPSWKLANIDLEWFERTYQSLIRYKGSQRLAFLLFIANRKETPPCKMQEPQLSLF
jgi:CRISPR type IV-associated protein Csf1